MEAVESTQVMGAAPSIGGVGLQRVRGEARLLAKQADGETCLDRLHQAGSAKVRLPRRANGGPLEAILLNTAGGLTGGDRIRTEIGIAPGAAAVISTQAAERAYRTAGGTARIETRLSVGSSGRLDWIPQETILFERSALQRSLDADIASDATLLIAEAVVLGRTAMGETLHDVAFTDTWRVRRGGRLVFADGTRIDGDAMALMACTSTGKGNLAFASILFVAPGAEDCVDRARVALRGQPGEHGVSAWNGLLTARLLAPVGNVLRTTLTRLIETLRGVDMPRVWNC